MDRNGFWVKVGARTKELISIIKVENDIQDSYWDFDLEEFIRLPRMKAELGMDDEWDKVSEEDALRLLNRDSWESADDEEFSE